MLDIPTTIRRDGLNGWQKNSTKISLGGQFVTFLSAQVYTVVMDSCRMIDLLGNNCSVHCWPFLIVARKETEVMSEDKNCHSAIRKRIQSAI